MLKGAHLLDGKPMAFSDYRNREQYLRVQGMSALTRARIEIRWCTLKASSAALGTDPRAEIQAFIDTL